MFGFFKSPRFVDPQLGELSRSSGLWRGTLSVEAASNVPLALSGSRQAPDPQALAAARLVADALPSWRAALEQALFEHYAPYGEAIAAGESQAPGEVPVLISGPAQVWQHVSPVFVAVLPLDDLLTTEIGYTTAWDEEHTLGARFRSGKLIELCGSVLPP